LGEGGDKGLKSCRSLTLVSAYIYIDKIDY